VVYLSIGISSTDIITSPHTQIASHITHIMQNEYPSESSAVEPESTPTQHAQSSNESFVITPQDAAILQQHLDDFEEADKGRRTEIIQGVMKELYEARPLGTHFNKRVASVVCLT
jgi:hypothetical protein